MKKIKKFKERFYSNIPTSTIVHRPLTDKTRAEIKQETKKEFMEWIQTLQEDDMSAQRE